MPWEPPANLTAHAAGARLVPYRSGITYIPGRGRQLSVNARGGYVYPPGLAVLKAYFERTYQIRQFYGRGRGRIVLTTRGPQLQSHEAGFALDVMNYRDLAKNHSMADWLLANVDTIGVQLIIADHRIWSSMHQREGARNYTGRSPHTDHVHFELSEAGLAARTPWFNGQPANPSNIALQDPSPDSEPMNIALVAGSAVAAFGGAAYYIWG